MVLGPLVAVVSVAAALSVTAGHLGAPLLRGGPRGWFGDVAIVVDACAALGLLGVPAALRGERRRRSGIGEVDAMSGREFEARLATLFGDLGYAVTRTGASGDFGADLLLEAGGQRLVVQAKRYDGSVGIEAVQQVIGATRYYDAARALVVTNSAFTVAASALAAVHDVELVDRAALVGLLASRPLDDARSPAASVLVREVAGGAALVFFALSRTLRLLWWVLRLVLRVPWAVVRARR